MTAVPSMYESLTSWLGTTNTTYRSIATDEQDEVEDAPSRQARPSFSYGAAGSFDGPHVDGDSVPVAESTMHAIRENMKPLDWYSLYFGFAVMMFIFELDNSTISSYATYATSAFGRLSQLASLQMTGNIISAIVKPPVAKISDVLGRAETYSLTVLIYLVSYMLCSASSSFSIYAFGYLVYMVGQAGNGILNSVMISDLSSERARGFAYNIIYLPFLVTPWISGLIVDNAIDGPGWRWGIGMFAVLMPLGAVWLAGTLFMIQRRAARSSKRRTTASMFCSQIDLGGCALLCVGLGTLLFGIAESRIDSQGVSVGISTFLLAAGVVGLAAFIYYERYFARNPLMPLRYFRTIPVVCALLLACIDNMGFASTHAYLYAWSIVSHDFTPRNALYLNYVNGMTQCLTGIATGALMYRFQSYKWIGVSGALIRLFGYAAMMRLRTTSSSTVELFLMQGIQGAGSGIIETVNVVSAQIAVPHGELAQITSLIALASQLGGSIGAAIAGSLYSGHLKEQLRYRLGDAASPSRIDSLFDSISGTLPTWGTSERVAVGQAYSDVMGYITGVALALSVPLVVLALLIPNKRLR